jgi:hypothetical protein
VKPASALAAADSSAADAEDNEAAEPAVTSAESAAIAAASPRVKPPTVSELMARLKLGNESVTAARGGGGGPAAGQKSERPGPPPPEPYEPITATPTEKLQQLTLFRAVHPLYGLYLIDYLGRADDAELIQILESLLEMPGSVARMLRVPKPNELPPGPLTTEFVDPEILTRGLVSYEELYPPEDQSDQPPELRKYPIPLAQKMRMLFESEIDHAGGLFVSPVWGVGDLLQHGGDFDKFVRARDLVKQEGMLFKHCLRMVLLCSEFCQLTPPNVNAAEWQTRLRNISDVLANACRAVDPQSTDELLEELEEDA